MQILIHKKISLFECGITAVVFITQFFLSFLGHMQILTHRKVS